ncbi:MAG: hypothetical protein QUU85_13045, partial [Candidatus Eisenbacteria bacterium]|nr:hypothetical protein [Candidatus Eisenbacteria bacterium]
IAATAAVVSMGERNLSRYSSHSVNALAAAESGVAYAKSRIVNQLVPMEDYDSDGRPDFTMEDSLDWGGSYRVIAEASDVLDPGVAIYHSNGITILSEGRYQGAVRRVKGEIAHDSFLKFARYVSQHALQFECGDVMAGEVYSGQSITLACGCPAGKEPRFLERVYAHGSIPQAACGIFEQGYVEDARDINILGSLDWDIVRNKARGIGNDTSCEGRGNVGIYVNLPGTDPLGLQAQAVSPGMLIFTRFDFMNDLIVPHDTVVTYGGVPVMNAATGSVLRREDFNGIIFFEGDAYVYGTLDGVSGYAASVYATDQIYIEGDVITGHTGFDPVTRLPNQSGTPVTAALIAENYVAMDAGTCRILRVDAALFSRTSNWRGLGGPGQHPEWTAGGPLDLDLDGILGETPVNHDPDPGVGWDELNITAQHWVLNLTGPIITYAQGDAYPWNADPNPGGSPGPTHRYNYDIDYMHFPPPCFPVPINVWIDVSWTEIFESLTPLASHLPD